MIHPVLSLSAALLAWPLAALAQATATPPASPSAPMPSAGASQLNRIEGKLDELLRRLDPPRPPPSTAVQGPAASFGTGSPSPSPSDTPPPGPVTYKAGAMAVAHAAPKDAASLAEIPPDSVGGFIYEGGPIALTDIHTRGVRYANPAGVEIQGWLRAKEAGRYQIGSDISAHLRFVNAAAPTCVLQAWLEGRSLDQRLALLSTKSGPEAVASLVVGAELQPGFYRLRVWAACTAPQGVTTTAELLLKAPSELNLRPVTGNDLLHRED